MFSLHICLPPVSPSDRPSCYSNNAVCPGDSVVDALYFHCICLLDPIRSHLYRPLTCANIASRPVHCSTLRPLARSSNAFTASSSNKVEQGTSLPAAPCCSTGCTVQHKPPSNPPLVVSCTYTLGLCVYRKDWPICTVFTGLECASYAGRAPQTPQLALELAALKISTRHPPHAVVHAHSLGVYIYRSDRPLGTAFTGSEGAWLSQDNLKRDIS